MKMSRGILLLTLTVPMLVLPLAACTADQMYNSAQGWRVNQCDTDLDRAEYDRCMTQANIPYDAYKQHTEHTEPDQKH